MACRDRNRIALQADLLGAHALGIRNLLCLTGDPVRAGDQADARPVNEFESVKLLQQVDGLQSGRGSRAGHPARWGDHAVCRLCRRSPIPQSWSGLQRRLQRKQRPGARFVQTQMVMDPAALERFQTRSGGSPGPARARGRVSAEVSQECPIHQPRGAGSLHPRCVDRSAGVAPRIPPWRVWPSPRNR